MRHNKKSYSATPRQQRPITGCISVSAEECHGNAEKMVRKFIKKVKKEGIVEEFRSRRYHVKPSEIRREEKRNKQRVVEKVNKRREELLKPRDPRFRAAKKKRRNS